MLRNFLLVSGIIFATFFASSELLAQENSPPGFQFPGIPSAPGVADSGPPPPNPNTQPENSPQPPVEPEPIHMPPAMKPVIEAKLEELQTVIDKYLDAHKAMHRYLVSRGQQWLFTEPNFEQLQRQLRHINRWHITDLMNRGFVKYPDILDPAAEDAYWRQSAGELVQLMDERIVYFNNLQQKAEAYLESLKTMQPRELTEEVRCNLPEIYSFLSPRTQYEMRLTDEQKRRVLTGGPCFINWEIDQAYRQKGKRPLNERELLRSRLAVGSASPHSYELASPLPEDYQPMLRFRQEIDVLLSEQLRIRNGNREVDATPELAALGLTSQQLTRWDGSTSMRPLTFLVIQHLCDKDVVQAAKTTPPFNQTHGAIVNVITGTHDLAFSTRMPSDDELRLAKDEGVELVCTPIAKDAFVFIKDRSNPVRNLTQTQVRNIFSGRATEWKQVGGFGGTITPLMRNPNSGSEELMKQLVLENVISMRTFEPSIVPSMMGVFEQINWNQGAIGYTVLYYEQFIVENPFVTVLTIDGITPTPETIASGKYPYVYQCVLIHRKNPDVAVKNFVAWLLSDEGQSVVYESGYVPVK